ncbi:MAG: hypothetical protein R2762_19805 [Bryobacteraceae bacterium]
MKGRTAPPPRTPVSEEEYRRLKEQAEMAKGPAADLEQEDLEQEDLEQEALGQEDLGQEDTSEGE